MHFNTLIDVHCINKEDLFSELLCDLKALACPKKSLKINLRQLNKGKCNIAVWQLNKGKCNIAVKVESVPHWSIWLRARIWLTCGHSSAVWLPCSNSKIATQPRVMKNRSLALTAQQTGCVFFSLCSSTCLDLTGSMYDVSPHLVLLHSRGCFLSVPVHVRCSFCNFLDFPIIIPSFTLTPSCEVNLETPDDSKFKE